MQEKNIEKRKVFASYQQMVVFYKILLHYKKPNKVNMIPESLVSELLSSRILPEPLLQ